MAVFNVDEIDGLLDAVATKMESSRAYKDWKIITDDINRFVKHTSYVAFSEDYIYKTLESGIKKAKKNGSKEIKANQGYLDALAYFLGDKNFNAYRKKSVLPQALKNCTGAWYSMVRCNSGREDILVSPVSIYEEAGKLMMKLGGPNHSFVGQIIFRAGCLWVNLVSGNDKVIHIILKYTPTTKLVIHPKLLKGVFTTITSTGTPISGYEVLVRTDTPFEALKNEKIIIGQSIGKHPIFEDRILAFFKGDKKKDLKVNVASTFDVEDLEFS